MKKLNKREIILAAVSIVLLAVFVLVQKVVKPLQEDGDDMDQRMQLSRGRLLKLQDTLAGEGDAKRQYGLLADTVGATDNANKDMPALLSRVQIMASDHNVHVLQIQPERVTEQNNIVFLPVQMEMTGTWPDIARFLAAAQASPEYFFINDLSLQKNSDGSANLYGRVTLSRMRLKSVL